MLLLSACLFISKFQIEGTYHLPADKDSYDCASAVEEEIPSEYLTTDGSIVTNGGSDASGSPQSPETPTGDASTSYMETTTPVGRITIRLMGVMSI